MLNGNLLTIHNVAVIAILSLVFHALAKPIFRMVDQVEGN